MSGMSRPPKDVTDAPSEPAHEDLHGPDGLSLDGKSDEAAEDASLEAELGLIDEALPAPLRRGFEVIRAHWQHAPQGPGVYRMIGEDGEVLYVGKAKSVRK